MSRQLQNPKPFLRWAGSKRKLVPKLAGFWRDSFERYVEPFMGSACLYFNIQPKNALLGDMNSDLIQAFQTVGRHPKLVAKKAHDLPKGREAFYEIRKQDPKRLSDLDAAARFIYLNRFCFNGLYRTNMRGAFNVPYGANKSGDLPTESELLLVSKSLRKASIQCGDFESLLKQVKANDFVYLDPPFAVSNRRVFNQYGPQTFGISDLLRLEKSLGKIDESGAFFVVSYAYCKEAVDIFKRWPKQRVIVQRNIAGFTNHRRRSAELLVSNI